MKLVGCIYCDLLVELHGDTEHEHGFSMKWHFERECQRHPMRKMEVDISALRATLDEERTSVLFWRCRYLKSFAVGGRKTFRLRRLRASR